MGVGLRLSATKGAVEVRWYSRSAVAWRTEPYIEYHGKMEQLDVNSFIQRLCASLSALEY